MKNQNTKEERKAKKGFAIKKARQEKRAWKNALLEFERGLY